MYSMPWHAIFAFLNPLLVGVLQVKGQSSKVSPFDTHPADMWTFLLATLLYCFAFAANIKYHGQRTSASYSRISGHVALLSGSLSSVSLLSIFLPTLLGRLIFILWLTFPMIVARQLNIHGFCHWLYQWTTKALLFLFFNTVENRCLRASNANNLAQEQPQPPV